MPDRITIYRLPICAMCDSEDEVVDEVRITVVHEVGPPLRHRRPTPARARLGRGLAGPAIGEPAIGRHSSAAAHERSAVHFGVPFPAKLLNENEEIVLDLQPHWWFFAEPRRPRRRDRARLIVLIMPAATASAGIRS